MRRSSAASIHALLNNGFPFSTPLSAHNSCVNALAFSNDGRFLISAGDDLQLRLWLFHQDDVCAPGPKCLGPRSNIFTIAISPSNRYIYSGGTDSIILKYDISSPSSLTYRPSDCYTVHQDSVRGITCHPVLDEVILSASEDGSIVRHDGRETSTDRSRRRAQNTLQLSAEMTGIDYHPHIDHLFVTSDSRGSVCLHDERMAFGPLTRRSHNGVVLQYNTRLCEQSSNRMSNPESSSVVFDRNGSRLAVTLLHYYPTIYTLSDPHPIAILSGNQLPDGSPIHPGERTYSNSCTMKHGTFGGPGLETDNLYVGGSDDFRGYVWKIPPLSRLLGEREIISPHIWESSSRPGTIAFTRGRQDDKCVPVQILRPLCRLSGHRSIVNATAVHPYLLHIATAGIERNVILHSPTPSSPCTQNLTRTPTETRVLSNGSEIDRVTYLRALRGAPMEGEADDPDSATISMFDHILREEGAANVFDVRPWTGEGSDSDDDDDKDMDSEDEL
ncbi:hypothetical protein APHAL10511_002261 [Amanita phalloides]|nr:hypothetical protein APHAL10511_002261 [Amanita phalloides]